MFLKRLVPKKASGVCGESEAVFSMTAISVVRS